MNQISCNVCMDLMPLVKDGIASEESCALVMNHIEICEDCAKALGGKTAANPAMDDVVVLIKLKKQITLFLLSVIFAGTLIGMVLSDGMSMFYNALIMPAIGGFGYMLFKKKSYFVPLGLFLFSFVWVSIREIVKGFLTYSTVVDLIIMSAWWSGVFAAFSAVGVLIAGLLCYAFKK
ncbi:zf-HC2 domain-containing protein [Desulfosporosinus hippei]|uniref:Putative zinc-finger n=1 Tax=Desulfosporosinus hippei DSM 8344 TaxID=1121419 RepID=A0A1G7VK69_9FIRM|nr:zf-HC2 domain-containing protein [Desulfosporosinus hippei]SDG59320.1 Putative zinc-finger [Desulfosporosinus hippei DSM 8344]